MLLMDLGNSRAKLALLNNTEDFISVDNSDLTADAIIAAFPDDLDDTGITVCSVRDESFNRGIVSELQDHDIAVNLLTWSDLEPYLKTAYETRQSLGLDRQVAMLGAMSMSPGPALVLDLGTASTIDALDANGTHLGGVIFPGYDLQLEALLAGTEDIVVKEKTNKAEVFPLSTADAVFSGTLQAWRGGVWSIHESMIKSMSKEVNTYVTGGQAPLLEVHKNDNIFVVPELVLKGIQFLVKRTT